MNRTQRPLDMAVDLGAVVGLSALALLGLDDSFAGRAYLVTGMVAVLAVVGWALLCTVQRYPAGVFLLVYSIAFPVLGATVALHNYDLLGFPAPSAMLDLLTATITAPGEFLTTIPPVDATGSVLAIPYVVGFVLCGPASWPALRTQRPLLPAVPLVLALVTCIVLGTEQPRDLVLRSGLFAGGLLLWVSLRASRLSTVAHDSRGRTVRAVAGSAVAVGAVVLASVWLPGVPHQDRDVLRGHVGSGQDVSQLDNPLASFRKYTSQPRGAADNVNDKRLLRVTGLPRSDLLRFVALDVYDGTGWTAGNRTVADDNAAIFQRIGQSVGAPRPGHPVRVGVEVKRAWTSSWLPLSGQLTGLRFDYLDGEAQVEDVRYNVATQTGMVVGGLQGGDDYHFTARVPTTRLTRSMRPYGSAAPLQPAGEFLDKSLRPWRTSGLTPVQQVFSLARYLRTNGRYSNGGARLELGYLPGHSPPRLGPGFFGAHTIVGDDEQYAAFMALAANRLGVPARVLVGAAPDRQGWVRGRNVLAWVEVRVADGSWRVLATDRFMSHKRPAGVVVRPTPRDYVKSTTEKASRTPAQQPQQHAPVPRSVQDVGRQWALWVVPLLAVVVLLVPGLKLLRRRRRRRASPVSARFVGGWEEVLDLLRDLGREVPVGLPRTEQARLLGISVELARAADTHVFGREEPRAEEAAAFWRATLAERRRLEREAGIFRRVASWWMPRSLLTAAASRWRRAGPRGPWGRAVSPEPGG